MTMDKHDDFNVNETHSLALRQLEGTLSPNEQQRLALMLLEDAAARRTYLENMQESACLRWLCDDGLDPPSEAALTPSAMVVRPLRRRLAPLIIGGGLL